MVKEICACTFCRKMLVEGDKMADLKIFKFGELDSILLAHENCAKQSGEIGWEWGETNG